MKEKPYFYRKSTFLYAFVLLSLFSCIDPFSLTLEEGQEFLVVDGEFTPETQTTSIKIILCG